jgi:branched-chain amino acid transport system ATP-binding protein
MLRIENLSAGYGKATVLRNVSMDVASDEVVSLIGPNGAGKSTLLKALTGLIAIYGGKISFDGKEIHNLPTERRTQRGISLVPEGRQIFGSFSVRDNLILGTYSYYRRASKSDIETEFSKVYELFPILKDRQEQKAGTLSGGEQQMLAIARGLMSRPRLLLLDEPSLGLAPLVVREIFRVVSSLHTMGLPVLIVEQNANAVLKISQRTYVIDGGRLVFAGKAADLLGQEALRKSYLGL